MIIDNLHCVQYGTILIEFELDFQDRKNMTIKVYPDCTVKIIAPLNSSLEKIEQRIKQKATWIIRQQREFLSYFPLTPERLYVSGETHLYLGRQYKIRVEEGIENEVKLFRGRLLVVVNEGSDVKAVLNKWYRVKAYFHFEEILGKVFPLFKKYKINKPEVHIRTMEKRWGSCTPSGKILLNPELIKATKGSIEYVIIHELCHLVHHNHTKAFYDLQEFMMPDWKMWKEKLEYSLA